MRNNRLVISGYYGFGNAGDDAVLAGIMAGLRRLAPAVEPVVLSADPAATSAMYHAAAVQRGQMPQVWHAIRQSDALLSGGGSLLQDVTSRRSVYYYLGVMAMAWLARRPFCIYGQGIGPLQAESAQRATRAVLARSRGIWVRDRDSHHLVSQLMRTTAGRPPVALAPDPAFMITPPATNESRQALRQALAAAGCAGSQQVWVVAARPWADAGQWQLAMVDALTKAAASVSATLAFVAMHPAADRQIAQEMVHSAMAAGAVAGSVVPDDLPHLHQLLAGADLVIALRLHALLLAVAAGVPGVAISYDPKVTALAQMLDIPMLTLTDLAAPEGSAALQTALQQAWQQRADTAKRLRDLATRWQGEALSALRAALESVGLPVQA